MEIFSLSSFVLLFVLNTIFLDTFSRASLIASAAHALASRVF